MGNPQHTADGASSCPLGAYSPGTLRLSLVPTPSAYLEAYSCDDCGTLDTAGSFGPSEVAGGAGLLFNRRDRHYCAPCSRKHWARWLSRLGQVQRRRARIRLYLAGGLAFGAAPLPLPLPRGLS
jgi:hypothetical protein